MSSDHDELVRKHSIPEEELTPEQRARRQKIDQWSLERRARGEVQSKEAFDRMNFPIGMDDNYNPFPVSGEESSTERTDTP
ncbi:hypothetical protein [Actinopolyspora mortivallis]|uniref:Uncharacterized protein n=1 Tax=Actinopolyspora mortivallis TaxID=33906 RepID=A0A2T0GW63_ACTMO|nr:hypothetical protein [Actinopolyspora mortivallis]PRW63355.1 hypothetical protein CEP50_11100 [Actinopolyspora mortivallis]